MHPGERLLESLWPFCLGFSLAAALFSKRRYAKNHENTYNCKGLLDTNALGHAAGHGHAYLKSRMWWSGMILMGIGELANFGAYAFGKRVVILSKTRVPAILVTPLGALSVVISAVLSSIFLKERLDFSGKIGCLQCVLGAIIIVLNAPENNSTHTVAEFFSFVLTPRMLRLQLTIKSLYPSPVFRLPYSYTSSGAFHPCTVKSTQLSTYQYVHSWVRTWYYLPKDLVLPWCTPSPTGEPLEQISFLSGPFILYSRLLFLPSSCRSII